MGMSECRQVLMEYSSQEVVAQICHPLSSAANAHVRETKAENSFYDRKGNAGSRRERRIINSDVILKLPPVISRW